jgi:hypothetical protein
VRAFLLLLCIGTNIVRYKATIFGFSVINSWWKKVTNPSKEIMSKTLLEKTFSRSSFIACCHLMSFIKRQKKKIPFQKAHSRANLTNQSLSRHLLLCQFLFLPNLGKKSSELKKSLSTPTASRHLNDPYLHSQHIKRFFVQYILRTLFFRHFLTLHFNFLLQAEMNSVALSSRRLCPSDL